MSLKGKRLSLDVSVYQEGFGLLGQRRGSTGRFIRRIRSPDSELDIQELHQSLSSHLRDETISTENLHRSDGNIQTSNHLKQVRTFHKLFQEIPEGESLTHTFTCALQKEVLYHGKLFISENYVCFHSSVLLKDTKVIIPGSSVQTVKKHKSALSKLSVQTVDGEKYSFVSLRNREMCHSLLQIVCSQAQGGSANSSPHVSSGENEAEHELVSNYSSLEDSVDHLTRQNSICLDDSFPPLLSEGPRRCSSNYQSSVTDEDSRGVSESWVRRIVERIALLFFPGEMGNLSVLFYIYMMLLVLLLLVSGYIGMRIVALEEQMGTLSELSLFLRDYEET